MRRRGDITDITGDLIPTELQMQGKGFTAEAVGGNSWSRGDEDECGSGRGYWGVTAVQQSDWTRHRGSRKTDVGGLMSLVGGSAKIHQERRQQENPKQIHHGYICKAMAEIQSTS